MEKIAKAAANDDVTAQYDGFGMSKLIFYKLYYFPRYCMNKSVERGVFPSEIISPKVREREYRNTKLETIHHLFGKEILRHSFCKSALFNRGILRGGKRFFIFFG